MRRERQAADTASRPEIVFSSPHVGKEAGTTAPMPYNGFSKQGQGKRAPPDERIDNVFQEPQVEQAEGL